MSQFDCYLERCRVGSQFCETVSERCRDCRDYIEYCFKDNQHISNCSTYCYDILIQNISLQTNSSMARCATPDDGYLSEVHHLVIEILLGIIIIGFVVELFVSRWQLVSEIIRRLNSVLPSTEPKLVSPDEKIELSVMQPLFPQVMDCQVTVGDPQESNCGFTQHNQIINSRKDDPSLCLSGR